MARSAPSVLLFNALIAVGMAAIGCNSSDDAKGASPSNERDRDAAFADAGPSANGADGSATTADGASAASGGSTAAATDAALRDAPVRPSTDASSRATPDAGVPDAALAPLVCNGRGPRFATGVVSYRFGPGQSNGQQSFPAWVLGPPEGAGACQGATDGVVSLGNGGFVVLEFTGDAIVDGPGPDFIVFENAFGVDCNVDNVFAELATVSVSDDGVTWTDFPCTATKAPYGECAGWHVVYANDKTNTIDPTDPAVAGGDPFDLADIGVARARFVRVTDRVDLTGANGVFDLDAVSIVHPLCP